MQFWKRLEVHHRRSASPPALARWFEAQGHEASHLLDLGLHEAADSFIWQLAGRDEAILVTKDEDFVAQWLIAKRKIRLIWIRKGNCSKRALVDWFASLWPDVLSRLQQGEMFLELRG